ncbi:MAG TPA: GMC oxidoreductase, partial [Polyangiaceae bacterium]|nr:GMC oxidoreductase [Polyangiaceae bacterium]
PDVQFHFVPAGTSQESFDRERFEAKGHAYTIVPVMLYPKSRGEIRLASADPAKSPRIDPRYLSDEDDLRLMVLAQRISQRIARSRVLDHCRGECLVPVLEAEDERTIAEQIRRRVNTVFHPVGTCRMGSDGAAVVDAKLRVRGIAGLRVVDASIMPTIVGGNTNAPTIMIAEKAADMIREVA